MKKLIILLIFSFILVFVGISGQNMEMSGGIHELYIPNETEISALEDVKITETGAFKIATCDDERYTEIKSSIPHILGESVTYKADKGNIKRILRRDLVTIYDDIADKDHGSIYGYSPLYGEPIVHNGHLVNMHINYGNNTIKIGTPLIMGSY